MGAPRLEARAVSKAYAGVPALAEVDLALQPGEVLGLVGENGAGKSTLMKCLAGVVEADAGEFAVDGQRVGLGSPRRPRAFRRR